MGTQAREATDTLRKDLLQACRQVERISAMIEQEEEVPMILAEISATLRGFRDLQRRLLEGNMRRCIEEDLVESGSVLVNGAVRELLDLYRRSLAL